MISDTLHQAIEDISEYQSHGWYDGMEWRVNGVKAVMDALLMELDSDLPVVASPKPYPDGMTEYVTELESRLGLKVVVRACDAIVALLDIVSPTGIAVAGGMLWLYEGRWVLGPLCRFYPEWLTPEKRAEFDLVGQIPDGKSSQDNVKT